jgi:hypothetical protein
MARTQAEVLRDLSYISGPGWELAEDAIAEIVRLQGVLTRIFEHFGPPQEATDDARECECFMCDLQRELTTEGSSSA